MKTPVHDYSAMGQTFFAVAAGLLLGDSWPHTFGIILALGSIMPFTAHYWKEYG